MFGAAEIIQQMVHQTAKFSAKYGFQFLQQAGTPQLAIALKIQHSVENTKFGADAPNPAPTAATRSRQSCSRSKIWF